MKKKIGYLFPSFITWKLTERRAFFIYQKLMPQYNIFNRAIVMKHHRKNVDLEFENPAAIFNHFCMILFLFRSHERFYCVTRI